MNLKGQWHLGVTQGLGTNMTEVWVVMNIPSFGSWASSCYGVGVLWVPRSQRFQDIVGLEIQVQEGYLRILGPVS